MKKQIICGLAVSLLALSCNGTALGELPMPHLGETLSASAEQAPVTYIDENGVEQTITEYKLLTGKETEIGSGTFVVNTNVSYIKPLKITGNTKLILCDGCTMSVYCGGKDYTYVYFSDLENEGELYDLSIYGQSKNTGRLSISRNYSQKELRDIRDIPYWDIGIDIPDKGLYAPNANITLNGGTVDVNCYNIAIVAKSFTLNGGTLKSKCSETALRTDMFTMNGGSCNAVSDYRTAIRCDKLEFNGGNMKANGGTFSVSHICDIGAGIYADELCINSEANDTFFCNSYWYYFTLDECHNIQRFTTVMIADGQTLIDQNGNTYSGTYSGKDVKALGRKTLKRVYSLTLPESTESGSVTADKSYYLAGDTVTLNVVPEQDYKVKMVYVNGERLDPTDNVFSFTMPAEDAAVEVEFEKCEYTRVPAVEQTYISDGNKEYYYDSEGNYYYRDPNGYGYIEAEKDSWILPMMTLVHVEAVAPTCLEAGNIEYWYDPVNIRYFADAKGERRIPKSNTVRSAYGKYNPTPEKAVQDGNKMIVSWYQTPGAEMYAVRAFINQKWRTIKECSETSCVLEGMTPGVEYKMSVISKFNGEWYNGQLKEFYVTLEKPNTYPTVNSVDYSEEFHQFRLNWSAADGAEKYGVAVKIAGKWKVQTYTNKTAYISPKLPAGSTFEVAVCARVNGQWDTRSIDNRAVTVTVK